MCPPKPWGAGKGYKATGMLLTHRREPLRTGVVGEVGKIFRKKRCGLQKGVIVVQVKRIIWGTGNKKGRFKISSLLICRSLLFPATSPCEQPANASIAEDVPNSMGCPHAA